MNEVEYEKRDNYNEMEERKHFCRIVSAFRSYKNQMMWKIDDKERYIKSLPPSHQALLKSYVKNLEEQKTCISHNMEVIKLIIKDVENLFENVQHKDLENYIPSMEIAAADLEKVQSILKHIVRDWSSIGQSERDSCYQPLINRVLELYPPSEVRSSEVQILVPGAGLGRLAFEFAKLGYSCQGNEFSLFMLFTSNFVLNKILRVNSLTVYPWCHQGSNSWTNADQLRSVSFPDVEPGDLPSTSHFSMAAGDFLEIYQEDDSWDCVTTCFFLDCANNIVSFVQTIFNILKPGGYWVNLGPLLYHFADIPGEKSIEPTYEVVKEIILGVGFTILDERKDLPTLYTQNNRSMLNYEYSSVFFTARKPLS